MSVTISRTGGSWQSGLRRHAESARFDVTYTSSEVPVSVIAEGRSDAEKPSLPLVGGLPSFLVDAYAMAALRHAIVQLLEDDSYFASVVNLQGVWGSGSTPQIALEDLRQSIPGWVDLHRNRGIEIPAIDGFDLNL